MTYRSVGIVQHHDLRAGRPWQGQAALPGIPGRARVPGFSLPALRDWLQHDVGFA